MAWRGVLLFDKDMIRQRGTLLMIYPTTNSQATRKEWDHVMEWGGRTKPFWGLCQFALNHQTLCFSDRRAGEVAHASGIYHLWPESVDVSVNQIGKCLRRVSYGILYAIAQEGHNEHGSGTLEPLTASAAHSKMAASVAFIFCWSTLKFHCLPQQS